MKMRVNDEITNFRNSRFETERGSVSRSNFDCKPKQWRIHSLRHFQRAAGRRPALRRENADEMPVSFPRKICFYR